MHNPIGVRIEKIIEMLANIEDPDYPFCEQLERLSTEELACFAGGSDRASSSH